jgi:hypothetical protein
LLIAFVALACLVPNGAHGRTEVARATPDPAVSIPSVGPALTVAPADWWMAEGTNVTLRASWTGIPPGCVVSPDWFRWSIESAGSAGTIAPDNGSVVNFTAGGVGSEVTAVAVRSAATVGCGTNRTLAFQTAVSNLTVDSVLEVSDLAIAPNPIRPGGVASLNGTIVGGDPPYELRLAWGDGGVSWANESGPGPFSVPRTFSGGIFSPSVEVEDAAGFTANASVAEPLNVSDGFAVAIRPTTLVAEVGVPVGFAIDEVNRPPGYSSIVSCGGGVSVSAEGPGPPAALTCAFEEPGTSGVSIEAVGATAPYAVATALLVEPVAPPLSVSLPSPPAALEVGLVEHLPAVISGGVPPYNISWDVVGNRSTQSMVVPSDGTVYVAIQISNPGADVLELDATDALGVSVASASETLDALAPLAAEAGGATVAGADGEQVYLSGAVTAGAPPFDWAVVPGVAALNATEPAGALAEIGPFGWNATYRLEGTLATEVVVVDAAGEVWATNVTSDLLPALGMTADWDPDSPDGFETVVTLTGGAPPFSYWLNESGGAAVNGTVAVDGTVTVRAPAPGPGNLTVILTVRDAWGATNATTATIDVGAPPRSPAGAIPNAGVLAFAALAVLAAVAAAGWWRRRSSRDPVPVPDPEATLRRIISPADGADRAVVELVAEEDGIPLTQVRETLDRLIADGTVRAERGPDGEEVLAWSNEPDR